MKRTTIQLDLHDPRLPALTEALSNKTGKVLLEALSSHTASVSELVQETALPFSTVDYTVKKLVHAGLLVEESHWWSVKGKSVVKYTLANTQIIISPRPLLKGVVPAVLCSGLFAASIRLSGFGQQTIAGVQETIASVSEESMKVAASASSVAPASEFVQPGASVVMPDVALWFLLGSFVGITLLLVWNVIVSKLKGGSIS